MKDPLPLCYLCRSANGVTVDHIPPKGLFSRPRPDNLLTVPCCKKCNNGFAQYDEFLQVVAALPINAGVTGKKAVEKVFKSTIPEGRIKKKLAEIKEIKRTTLQTAAGPMPASVISYPARFVRRLMVRLTKGLLYALYPDIDYSNFEFEVTPLGQFNSAKADEVLRQEGLGSSLFERGGGVLKVCHTVFEMHGYGGWFYSFHGALGFYVTHRIRTGQPRKNSGVPFKVVSEESGKIIPPRKV